MKQTQVRDHILNINLELSTDNISTDKSGFGTQMGKGVGFASRQAIKVDDLRATGGSQAGIGVPTLQMLNPELYKEM